MSTIQSQTLASADQVRRFFEARDHLRRGICLLNAGQYDRAAGEFTASLHINPNSDNVREYLAKAQIGRRDDRAAADAVAETIKIDPENVTARVRHALLLYRDGDTDGAIRSLRRGVGYAPDCAELHFQLGTILAAHDAQDEAELRFTQALVLDRKHVGAIVGLSMCYAATGDVTRSLNLLSRAHSLEPSNARVGFLLSVGMRAEDTSERILTRYTPVPDDDAGAIDELRKLIEADPDFVDAFLDLPDDHNNEEVCHLIDEAIDGAIREDCDRADLFLQRGRVLRRIGRLDQAITVTEESARLDPNNANALIHLARLYQNAGRHSESASCLERALATGVRYADAFLLLGDAYRHSGEVDRAETAYREAVHINQDYKEAKEALASLASLNH
jgi:tetratricopeptide (TPR) repeat protein